MQPSHRLAKRSNLWGRRRTWGRGLTVLALLLPSLLVLALFTYWPIIYSTILSLFRKNLFSPVPSFVGLANYRYVLHDPLFWKVMLNTGVFILMVLPTSMALGLLLALALERESLSHLTLRAVLFHPVTLPMIGAASLFLFIYDPISGLLHDILGALGIASPNWLGNPSLALAAVAAVVIWKGLGLNLVIYLAGLKGVNPELREAARIDGASAVQIFGRILLPLLGPTTFFLWITGLTFTLQAVDPIWLLTAGGPNNATNTLLFYVYQKGFQQWDQGVAATLSTILILILVLITLASLRFLESRIYYEA